MINRPHKNLAHEAGFFWEQILQHYLGFDRREQLTLALDQIEPQQWRRFYRDNFLPLPSRSTDRHPDWRPPGEPRCLERQPFDRGC